MPKRYSYIDYKSNKTIFETVQPNHVSDDDVNAMFKEKTGRDYRLEKALINREIRVVKER